MNGGHISLLVLAPNPWSSQWVNRQQLMSRLGHNHNVLYSTGGWFTWHWRSPEWWKGRWFGNFHRSDNVWIDESPRILMRNRRLPLLDAAVLSAQAGRWKRFLTSAASPALVSYIFHPVFFPYVRKLGAEYLVYHAYDMYDHTPGWNEELERHELELLEMADLVIASSEQTAESLRQKVSREVKVLPNGADVAAFDRVLGSSAPAPNDLRKIPAPRLGYVGSVNPKVDCALIADLAKRRPDWNFVFVGQIVSTDEKAEADRRTCAALANVHFLGEKPVYQVPLYASNMDVNLMCYRRSDSLWTKWIYPLKLHEYLATGRPVVSSDVPSVREFSDVVRIASNEPEWHDAIEHALLHGGQGTPERRRRVAAENSWDRRVRTLTGWLTDMTIGHAP